MSNNRNKMHDWEYPATIAGSLAIVTAAYFLPYDVGGTPAQRSDTPAIEAPKQKAPKHNGRTEVALLIPQNKTIS